MTEPSEFGPQEPSVEVTVVTAPDEVVLELDVVVVVDVVAHMPN